MFNESRRPKGKSEYACHAWGGGAGLVFGEPRRESMIWISQLRYRAAKSRRSSSLLAGIMDIRAVLAATTLCVSIAGCGPSANAPAPAAPPIAAKPDVIITFDGKRHACVVALYREEQGSAVPCTDVVPFVRDELRLPSGSIYDVRTISDFDKAEMAGVGSRLNDAGYRFIGGPNAHSR